MLDAGHRHELDALDDDLLEAFARRASYEVLSTSNEVPRNEAGVNQS